MNLVITQPNAKGQIVIPKKFRDELDIDNNVQLALSLLGAGIYIRPIKDVVTAENYKKSFTEILEMTRGSWAGDDWPKTAARRRRIELAASKRRKAAW